MIFIEDRIWLYVTGYPHKKRDTLKTDKKRRKKDRIKCCKIAPKKPTHKNLKIEARFLADFPMLHLYRMFAFLSNKTILHLLKGDTGASFLKFG